MTTGAYKAFQQVGATIHLRMIAAARSSDEGRMALHQVFLKGSL
tara:strand:+ start:625 stop:756 length:132 start_codon:yes stop_codon:yes gene_type:complete